MCFKIKYFQNAYLADPSKLSGENIPNRKLATAFTHVRVLLLGGSEAGKSTLSLQLRLIHGKTFNEDETIQFKHIIRASCLEYFHTFLHESGKDVDEKTVKLGDLNISKVTKNKLA